MIILLISIGGVMHVHSYIINSLPTLLFNKGG